MEYSLIPYVKEERATAYGLGYVFACNAVQAVGTDIHSGTVAPQADYVSFDNEYIRMTAFKKAEYSNHHILRLFNSSEEAQPLTISLGTAFHSANRTNLGEEFQEALNVKDGKLNMTVPAKKIVTLELF